MLGPRAPEGGRGSHDERVGRCHGEWPDELKVFLDSTHASDEILGDQVSSPDIGVGGYAWQPDRALGRSLVAHLHGVEGACGNGDLALRTNGGGSSGRGEGGAEEAGRR